MSAREYRQIHLRPAFRSLAELLRVILSEAGEDLSLEVREELNEAHALLRSATERLHRWCSTCREYGHDQDDPRCPAQTTRVGTPE